MDGIGTGRDPETIFASNGTPRSLLLSVSRRRYLLFHLPSQIDAHSNYRIQIRRYSGVRTLWAIHRQLRPQRASRLAVTSASAHRNPVPCITDRHRRRSPLSRLLEYTSTYHSLVARFTYV